MQWKKRIFYEWNQSKFLSWIPLLKQPLILPNENETDYNLELPWNDDETDCDIVYCLVGINYTSQ